MSVAEAPVSDLLAMVKSREVQRGMAAEARRDTAAAARHFLAAAHMELVLADDFAGAGQIEHSIRSRISAGSCFWRGGLPGEGRQVLEALAAEHPDRAEEIREVVSELESGRS